MASVMNWIAILLWQLQTVVSIHSGHECVGWVHVHVSYTRLADT